MPQAFWSASACSCMRPCSSMCAPSTDIVYKQRSLTYQSSVVLAVSGSPHLVVAAGNLSCPRVRLHRAVQPMCAPNADFPTLCRNSSR